MAYKNNAKFGFQGFTYPAPKELTTPFEKANWQMEATHELGCSLFNFRPMGMTEDEVKALNELKAKYEIESEGYMIPAIFQLNGWDKMSFRGQPVDAVKAKEDLEAFCEKTVNDGIKITRGGYGRL